MSQQFEPFQKILVRDNDHDNWRCGFFSHIRGNHIFKYTTTEGVWTQCVPYEGNEHLVGTNSNPTPPELEFKFGDHVEVSNDRAFWIKAVYHQKRVCYQKNDVPMMSLHWVVTEDNTQVRSYRYCRKADW